MKTFLIAFVSSVLGTVVFKAATTNTFAATTGATGLERMEVVSGFNTPSGYSGTILRDRETGEEYMTIHHGGTVHLVKPSTTPKQ